MAISYNKTYYFEYMQTGGISISSSFVGFAGIIILRDAENVPGLARMHLEESGGAWGEADMQGLLFFAPLLDRKCYCTLGPMPCNIQSETHCLIPFGNFLTCTGGLSARRKDPNKKYKTQL